MILDHSPREKQHHSEFFIEEKSSIIIFLKLFASPLQTYDSLPSSSRIPSSVENKDIYSREFLEC